MILVIVVLIAILAAALVISGFPRVYLPRKPGLEGIEEREAARAYDRISRWPQFSLLRRMIAGKLAKYRPTGTLADIGCGPGHLAILIAQKHRDLQVLGIDTSGEMIHTASSITSSLGLSERVTFRKGDVTNLPLSNDTLDFAVSTMSLHHWSDPDRGLSEIHRVLKNGGQLLLFDLRRDSRRFFYWLMRFAQGVVVPGEIRRANEPLGSVLSSYTLVELEDLLAGSPFKEWKIEGGLAWMSVWARKS